ncbi:unnamed protein product [Choristocarpus tenellus]
MGVLKIVLGIIGFVELVFSVAILTRGFAAKVYEDMFGGPLPSTGTHAVAGLVSMHMMSPYIVAMAVMNIMSWEMGSDMRPRVAIANIAALLGCAAVQYGFLGWGGELCKYLFTEVALALAVVAGLVAHVMEPGLFTKDKSKSKAG